MKTFATILFSVIGTIAVLFGACLSWNLLSNILTTPTIPTPTTAGIHYSSKQVDVLKETANALIPTVVGFAVLAASGAGYLYTHRHMRSQALRLGVVSVFVALVVSMACFVLLLGAVVDCSRPFDRLTCTTLSPEITAMDARYLQRTYVSAVTSAKLACISFFFALDIALLIAIRMFYDSRVDPLEDVEP